MRLERGEHKSVEFVLTPKVAAAPSAPRMARVPRRRLLPRRHRRSLTQRVTRSRLRPVRAKPAPSTHCSARMRLERFLLREVCAMVATSVVLLRRVLERTASRLRQLPNTTRARSMRRSETLVGAARAVLPMRA